MQEFDESCCQVVEFVRGDATDDTCDWSDADLVYMNSTCFDDDVCIPKYYSNANYIIVYRS